MSRQGSIYKRCTTCGNVPDTDHHDGRCDGTSYTWSFQLDVAPVGAPRKLRTRGGFDTKREAQAALDDVKGTLRDGTHVEPAKITVGEYLHDRWLPALEGDPSLRGSTRESHALAARRVAPRDDDGQWTGLPRLGSVRLQQLSRSHIKACYGDLRENGRANGKGGLAPKTVHNVHLALHRALADAVDDRLIPHNPCDSARKGRALHSAPERPEIDVWTADQLAAFLATVAEDRQYALWHLAAHTGMRRGELVGMRWDAVDLDAGLVTVIRQRVKVGSDVEVGRPKTSRSRRTIDIDPDTIEVLRDHRRRQLQERLAIGPGWTNSGLVFTREDGQPLHPDVASQRFVKLVEDTDVPRITLHGLRHTHGTLMLAAGVALHVVSRRLGHASEAFTAQVYAHVLPQQQAQAAARFAALLERNGGDAEQEDAW